MMVNISVPLGEFNQSAPMNTDDMKVYDECLILWGHPAKAIGNN